MGNSSHAPLSRVLLIESQLVGRLRSQIEQLIQDVHQLEFCPIEELQIRLAQDHGKKHIIAECVFKQRIEKAVEAVGPDSNAHQHYIKTTMEPNKYLEELKDSVSSLLRTPKSDGDRHRPSRSVTVKFIDRHVHSPHYELFINYMQNREVSYELHQTVADFVQSQKKTRCEFVIVSLEFSECLPSTHAKVYCFCNKEQERQNKLSSLVNGSGEARPLLYESNFTRIIKLILNERKQSCNKVVLSPVKVLAVWKRGFDEQTFSELTRRKVHCRFIASEHLTEIVEVAKKSLYTTVVLHSQNEWRQFEDAAYINHLQGRVFALSCVRGRHRLMKNLDHHLNKGYELTEKRVKSITFVGDIPYLDKMRCIEPLLFAEGVKSERIEPKMFMAEPYHPLAVVTPIQLAQRLRTFLKKSSYSTIVMSLNLDSGSCDQEHEIQRKEYVNRMLKELSNRTLCVSNGGYSNPRLHGIMKDLHEAENGRHLFLEVQESGSRGGRPIINYTAKFTNLLSEDSTAELFNVIKRMWRLNYNPIDNYRNFLEDVLNSLRRLARLRLLKLKSDELQNHFTRFRQCSSFVSVIELLWNLYLSEHEFQSCLKLIMAGLDKYVSHEKVELVRPLVLGLVFATSGLLANPRIEPMEGVLRLDRNRLTGLQKGSKLITHQFIQAELRQRSVPGTMEKNEQILIISYSPQALVSGQFYSGLRIHDGHLTLCPHSQLLVTDIRQDFRGSVLKVELVKGAGLTIFEELMQSNFHLSDKGIAELFVHYEEFTTGNQQHQIQGRLTLNKFLLEMQLQRFFEARSTLENYKASYTNDEFLRSAQVYCLLGAGEFCEAAQKISQLTNDWKRSYWQQKLLQVTSELPHEKSIVREKEPPMKWTVHFSKKQDAFQIEDSLTGRAHLFESRLRMDSINGVEREPETSKNSSQKKTRAFAYSADCNSFKLPIDLRVQHHKSTLSKCLDRMDSLIEDTPVTPGQNELSIISSSQEPNSAANSFSKITNENIETSQVTVKANQACDASQSGESTEFTQGKPRKRHKIIRRVYKML